MDSSATIMWSILFGAIGLGFFTYGTKQRAAIPFVTGVGLFIIPYIFTNVYLLILAGVILIALPYFVRL